MTSSNAAILLLCHALVTAALFYLGSRAVITQALWSRYPARLAAFMDCAACTGFWWGAGTAAAAIWGGVTLPIAEAMPATTAGHAAAIFVTGLCALVWTPIVAAVHQQRLDALGSAIAPPSEITACHGGT